MYLTLTPGPYVYDNVYKVWCPKCRAIKKIVNPKTLHLPECSTCSCKCWLKAPTYTEHSFTLRLRA